MEGEIAKATAALVTALEHGSAHSAGELYADDATLLAPGCEPIRGRTSIEAYWATGIRLGRSALASERHVLKALGGQAVDAGRYTISIVSDAAGPVAEHGTYVVLYRQVAEGSWRRDIEIFSADEPTAATGQEPARASFQPSRSLAAQPQTTPTSQGGMVNPIPHPHPPTARPAPGLAAQATRRRPPPTTAGCAGQAARTPHRLAQGSLARRPSRPSCSPVLCRHRRRRHRHQRAPPA